MKKKGFTLIELLAVIIILAIIALIAIPQIIKILNKTRLKSAENSTYGIVKATDNYVANFMLQNSGMFPNENLVFLCNGTECELQTTLTGYNLDGLDKLEIKGTKPKSGTVTISNSGKDVRASNLIINSYICNYNGEKASCNVNDGVTPPTARILTYNGSNQTLINAGSILGGSVEYKVGESGTYSYDLPEAITPGIYKVYYKVTKDGRVIKEDYINVEIRRQTNNITLSETSGELEYLEEKIITVTKEHNEVESITCTSSNEAAATCEVIDNDIDNNNRVKIIGGATAATNVSITINSAETTNYESGQAVYTVTSRLATMSVTVSNNTYEYDGNGHGITVTPTPNDATVRYMDEDGNYTLTTSPLKTEIGEYTIYYEVTKIGHATIRTSETLTITQPVVHYALGEYSTDAELIADSVEDYTELTHDGTTPAKLFVKLQSGQKSVCIIYDDSLGCFRPNNYENETINFNTIFGSSNCTALRDEYHCENSSFICKNGKNSSAVVDGMYCYDRVSRYTCIVYSNGVVSCR